MTISYSLDVAKARFCGLAQLLLRWKGGVYKILWREFLLFCMAYTALSVTYRYYLSEEQKVVFEKWVIFVETFTNSIPLSFVLGFYVSLVIGRWWSQYETIPWPDRIALSVSCYVQGNDERSRMIRRTLVRYAILAKVLTFQAVSTSVKRRFPSTQHLVAAGIMTQAERSVYEKVSFPYGKWWLPLHWFTALATRAFKENRIKDSILLNGLFKEILDFRTSCAIMFGYDWISVPLIYTQVVTIAIYTYSLALVIGSQYLDPSKGYPNHEVDLYIPFFTLLQFFFYFGWLKVAEQILNPYGEDDDDFELNWCLDRGVHLSYITVDHLRMKHPKVDKDYFWDEMEPVLPQTKESAFYSQPQLGSAFYLNVDDAEYLPMDSLFEEDEESNVYSSESVKRPRGRPSLLQRIMSTKLSQSRKKKSIRRTIKNETSVKGIVNQAFDSSSSGHITYRNATGATKTTSLNNAVNTYVNQKRPVSAPVYSDSIVLDRKRQNCLQNEEKQRNTEKVEPQHNPDEISIAITRSISVPAEADGSADAENTDNSMESDIEPDNLMPSIVEETSRATSAASIEVHQDEASTRKRLDAVHDLVEDANRMLLELKRSISAEHKEGDLNAEKTESISSTEIDNDDDSACAKEQNSNVETAEVVIEIAREENRSSSFL
ncbi:bestrophin-4-like [Parasteatoda tepidariorum]|uniref:bestrophin-4-like n=1 Tax=Parasteatoda tepidariorum TaxID=114398 RepID=UPI00077FB5E0|nr:bestrophin-4-like [Parasteatoda tepidariorum]